MRVFGFAKNNIFNRRARYRRRLVNIGKTLFLFEHFENLGNLRADSLRQVGNRVYLHPITLAIKVVILSGVHRITGWLTKANAEGDTAVLTGSTELFRRMVMDSSAAFTARYL
jgi:hypothetical protein